MADRIFKLTFLGDASKALREIGKLDSGMSNMGNKVAKAGLAAGTAMGGAAVGGLAKAITLAADYEHAIDAVAAVAQATAAQEKQLYDKGREIGRRTAFTALESAAAMEELAAQGLTVEQIINGAADATVNLAAAGGTDLVTAATAIAGTMDVWKLGSEDMVDVVNRIAGAANVSKFDVANMNLAIGQGAGVAKAAGVSYQDFLATIAASASSFSSGSDAGTGAKTFFQTIIGRSGPAKKAMKEFGLITKEGRNLFYDSKGDFLGMANAADVLNEAFAGLSDAARTEALGKIFGSDASRTAAALMEKGALGFEAISDAMGNNDAADQAAKRLGNLKGALEQLKGSLEDVGIAVGEKLLGPLTQAAEFLAEWIPKIPTDAIIAVGAIMGIVGAFSMVGFAVIGLGALGGPVALIVLAIAALVGVAVLLWQNWDTVKAKAEELGIPLGMLEGVVRAVGDAFAWAWEQGSKFASLPMPNLLGGGGTVGDVAGPALAKGALAAIPVVGPALNILGGANSIYKGIKGGFADGGVIPGPTGAPRLIMAHAGETVLPTHRGGMGGVVININGSLLSTSADIERAVVAALQGARLRGALPA